MKKNEFIEMLLQENTESPMQKLYNDVIDCVDIALSQEPDTFEIADTSAGLADLFGIIETTAKKAKCTCVGPFEAAELFAKKFGAKYVRPSRRAAGTTPGIVNLADFL